jgi:hypothetical protein
MNTTSVQALDSEGHELNLLIDWKGESQRGYSMTATVGRGKVFHAQAADCFAALTSIREQLEPIGIRLLCCGSRRDVWAPGMQRDMGQGLVAYVCSSPRSGGRPATVGIFDLADRNQVGTVAEQRAHFELWLQQPPN